MTPLDPRAIGGFSDLCMIVGSFLNDVKSERGDAAFLSLSGTPSGIIRDAHTDRPTAGAGPSTRGVSLGISLHVQDST